MLHDNCVLVQCRAVHVSRVPNFPCNFMFLPYSTAAGTTFLMTMPALVPTDGGRMACWASVTMSAAYASPSHSGMRKMESSKKESLA